MKHAFRRIAVISILIALVFAAGLRADITQADKFYGDKLYDKALESYNEVYKSSQDQQVKWRAFYRARMCESMLGKFGEGLQTLMDTPLPDDPAFKCRILMLKVGTLSYFKDAYYYIMQDMEDAEEKKDVFKMEQGDIDVEIDKMFSQLWDLRDKLVSMPLKNEEDYFILKNINYVQYPTMFDFLILKWSQYIIERGYYNTIPSDAAAVLVEDYKQPVDLASKSRHALLAALYEFSSNFKIEGRKEAAEMHKVMRLLLPLNGSFDLQAVAEPRNSSDDADFKKYVADATAILLKWVDTFTTKTGKAYAGLQAASQIGRTDDGFVKAVALCERVEKEFPDTPSAVGAKALRLEIQYPTLNVWTTDSLPGSEKCIKMETRNIPKVYFRIFKLKTEDIKMFDMKRRNYQGFYGWSSFLRWPGNEFFEYANNTKAVFEFTVDVTGYEDYKHRSIPVSHAALEKGVYAVIGCSSPAFNYKATDAIMSGSLLNMTDIMLTGSEGVNKAVEEAQRKFVSGTGPAVVQDAPFRFYVFTSDGKPVDGAAIDAPVNLNYGSWSNYTLRTDSNGTTALAANIPLNSTHMRISTDPLAMKSGSAAFMEPMSFDYYTNNPIRLSVKTDRPIYRPGDKCNVKITSFVDAQGGYQAIADKDVMILASDPNGQNFFTFNTKTNSFGSASAEFVIPTGRMLGNYNIGVVMSAFGFQSSANGQIRVEEYKRPEFEIALDADERPWKYGEQAEVKGSVKYYFGGATAGADLSYRVTKFRYLPWSYYSWRRGYGYAEETVVSGTLKTDEKGKFSIPFKAEPVSGPSDQDAPDFTEYSVFVEARDAGGRVINASRSYRAGKTSSYITLSAEKGFFMEQDKAELDAAIFSVNDTPMPGGKYSYEVFALADPKEDVAYAQVSLDQIYEKAVQAEKVASGDGAFGKDARSRITVSGLKQGVYRLVVKNADLWGSEIVQKKVFLVVKGINEGIPLTMGSFALPDRFEHKVGETARFVIGSPKLPGYYHIEIWNGQYLLERRALMNGIAVQMIEVPVTESMKGGLTVRWIGSKDLVLYSLSADVFVPWDEKKLTAVLAPFKNELKPGELAKWGVTLTDRDGKPVEGEVLAIVYDRSLEYYAKQSDGWLEGLFGAKGGPTSISQFREFTRCSFSMQPNDYYRKYHIAVPYDIMPEVLRVYMRRGDEKNGDEFGGFMEDSESGAPGAPMSPSSDARPSPKPMTGKMKANKNGAEEPELMEKKDEKNAAPEEAPRGNFADTALFLPLLATDKDGKGTIEFKAPDQLTSWRVKLFALTRDAKYATVIEQVVTKKDLMVRADLPRFFREKDSGTVELFVHNETDKELEGEAFIDIFLDEKSAAAALGLKDAKKVFKVPAKSAVSFSWMLSIPVGIETYKVRVSARSGELSDSEERTLPILPSRQRLMESRFAVLDGNSTQKMEFNAKPDATRLTEQMVLQVEPQLALSILNTIPYLVQYPHECVEQTMNKYVPLAIVNAIFEKSPALKEAFGKVPKRDSKLPAWEQDDPNRMTRLMETPWAEYSRGQSQPNLIAMDPETVKRFKEKAYSRLRLSQNPDGSFPWWPGYGKGDLYMTMYVLAGFAEAKRYGVEIPVDMADRALGFVAADFEKKIKEEKLFKEEYWTTSFAYAAYVLTSYPEGEFTNGKRAFETGRKLAAMADGDGWVINGYSKAYLAYAWYRLGEKDKALLFLEQAMVGLKEDPLTGIYWAPERYSWLWYNDDVERHAFFLKALQDLKPGDARIAGMVKWLLFNRKGNEWKSTKASAAAVFALLDYLNSRGGLSGEDKFAIEWGGLKDSFTVKPTDYNEKPMRIVIGGSEATPEKEKGAVVTKEGAGIAFTSLTWRYSTDLLAESSGPGLLQLERKYYIVKKDGGKETVAAWDPTKPVKVGDKIEVRLKVVAKSQFEYMHLMDPKPAGFEAEDLLSGWKWDGLSHYREQRDSLTNFFVSWLPQGEYELRYRLRPTKAGVFRLGAATLQSMYAPDMTAHSAGIMITVEP